MERLGSMDVNERYMRQIALDGIGEEGQIRISKASVLVVGAGGLGSSVLLYLAAAGIGTLGIIDDDLVGLSNLQRQVLYEESQIGLPKVEMAAKRIKSLNSDLHVKVYRERLSKENAWTIIPDYDLVIDATDNYETRYLMDKVCCEQHKPLVYGSISGYQGQVSVFHYAGSGGYRDLFPEEVETEKATSRFDAVIGTLPGIIGCIQANEALKICVGLPGVLSRKLLVLDCLSMQFQLLQL